MHKIYFVLILVLPETCTDDLDILYKKTLEGLSNLKDVLQDFKEFGNRWNETFSFPGTNWCYNGPRPENIKVEQKYRSVDDCCKSHFYCSDIMRVNEKKHGLINKSSYTKYKCRCEMKFYNCLTNAKTLPAQVVKELYFSFYGTECYKCDYPAEQCIRYSYIFFNSNFRTKCIKYEIDRNRKKRFQWFDVFDPDIQQ